MSLDKPFGITYISSKEMKRNNIIWILGLLLLSACSVPDIQVSKETNQLPDIFPLHHQSVIPFNIAPLNFKFDPGCEAIQAKVKGPKKTIFQRNKGNKIIFNISEWKELLAANRGDSLNMTVFTCNKGEWTAHSPVVYHVSPDPIDDYLVYRLIMPGFQNWNQMGIYQRNLTTFDQEPILDSRLMPGTCMNCHAFAQKNPDNMLLHLRENNAGTILIRDRNVQRLNTKTPKTFSSVAFPYWHPSGKYIAFSINKVRQVFHSVGHVRAHALDMESDMVIMDVEKNELRSSTTLFAKEAYEAFPCFSPDGKKLYYVSAPAKKMPESMEEMKYSLCAIDFDAVTGMPGNTPDTLIAASKTGRSVSIPRVSPDGRFISVCRFNYGNFPSYNPESDIYLYDLEKETFRPLTALNSNDVESYHSWSSNGRWMAVSSRRMDGLYSNVYLAHMDAKGTASIPFLMPQEDPDFHSTFLFSFNLPEFVIKPVPVKGYRIEEVAKGKNIQQTTFGEIQQHDNR